MKYKCKINYVDNDGNICFLKGNIYNFSLHEDYIDFPFVCERSEKGIWHYLSIESIGGYFIPYKKLKFGH